MSTDPSLDQTESGALRLHWGCFACGRTHHHMQVTLRFNGDQLEVIGYDVSYADRLNATVFTCSINLLTGDAMITAGESDIRHLNTPDRPFAATTVINRDLLDRCDALSR